MARATVELPSMIANLLGGVRRFGVEGATLGEALADAFARHPALRVHVVDERGAFREHVLCFLNDVNTRWTDDAAGIALNEGDRITFLQAVSGG